GAGRLLRHRAAPPAGGIAGLRERQGLEAGETGLAHFRAHRLDQVQQHQRRFALLDQDAVVLQRAVAALEERLVEQALGRADRVGGIDDHDVHAAGFAVRHVGDAVVPQQFGARVAVGFAQFGEILLRHPRDLLVDVALHGFLDAGVAQHLAQGAAVAAADDDHVLRVRMREQRRVRHHLVVEEVVAGGQHHRAVDQHDVAPVGRLVDLDVLEVGLHLVQLAGHPEADRRAGPVEFLVQPGGLGHVGGSVRMGRGADCNGAGGIAVTQAIQWLPPAVGTPDMTDWSPDLARKAYSIPHWAGGYFDVDARGGIVVRPKGAGGPTIALPEVVDASLEAGGNLPVLVRFPDILGHRLGKLQAAFAQAQKDWDYPGGYTAVYPIKVNQHAGVAGTLASHHGEGFGLEAGSKPELMAVLALSRPGGLIVCNGYKDREYIRLALIGRKLGLQTFIVIEKPSELKVALEEAEKLGVKPGLGVRMRLASLGSGKWQNSGGDKAKFGLDPRQLLNLWKELRDSGMGDCLQLLHFHRSEEHTS